MSALENCEIISFSTDNLRVDESGAVALANRVFETFVEGELKAMTLFREIPTRLMKAIVPLFGLEEHSTSNSSVFEEGDAGDKFYILLHGQVAVVKGDLTLAVLDSHAQDVHDGHPFFGEMALLDSAPRMAAIRTRTPCKMLVLNKPQFGRFLSVVSDFKQRLRRTKELRQKESELNVQNRTENYSIDAHRVLDEDEQERVDALQLKLAALQEEAEHRNIGARINRAGKVTRGEIGVHQLRREERRLAIRAGDEEAAATSIQSSARGAAARGTLRGAKGAATSIQSASRGAAARRRVSTMSSPRGAPAVTSRKAKSRKNINAGALGLQS